MRSRKVCFSQNSIWIYKIDRPDRCGVELDMVRLFTIGDRGPTLAVPVSSSNPD
jgi:hypothetical protein